MLAETCRATVLAAAKINLCLRVVGLRPDGYHLLDGIIAPISLFDSLELSLAPARHVAVRLDCNQPGLPADEHNLVVKAARLFLERTEQRAALAVGLHKEIPVGAGLGGGSSDAAAVLTALNYLTRADIDLETLMRWGVELGADVPFFLVGRPARVHGIGEQVSPFGWTGPRAVVVAFPGVGLSTAAVYAAYDRSLATAGSLTSPGEGSSLLAFSRGQTPLRVLLANDLEAAASEMYPPVRAVKMRLLGLGASGALMTGSGSAVFGIWEERDRAVTAAERLRSEDGIWARAVEVVDHVPEVTQNRVSNGGR